MIIQTIRLKSDLPKEELLKRADERKPQFKTLKGLHQKHNKPGHYAGVYVWESKEAMLAYEQSDLSAATPKAYEIIAPPELEVLDVMLQLRD